MIFVRGQVCPAKGQASEALTGLLSNRSDNGDYKNFLESNKPGPSKASARPFQALSLKTSKMDVVWFIQKDLDQII